MPGEQTLSGHFRFRKGIILGLCKLLKIRRRFLRKIQGLYFLQDALCFSERPQTTEKMRGKTCEKIRRHVEKSVKCVYVQGEKRRKPFQNNGKYAQCRFF